ncbi:MAG: hypothetical protein AAF675_15360 [Pseudomonadota bacterium]
MSFATAVTAPRPVRLVLALTLSLAVAGPALASGWSEPAWGTALRRTLMDAVRPIIERNLGAPVEFVVRELRVAENSGFGWLEPQRPGGRPIVFEDTPLGAGTAGQLPYDGTTVHVFWRRENGRWLADEWSIGATDAWWTNARACAEYRPLIHDYCGG